MMIGYQTTCRLRGPMDSSLVQQQQQNHQTKRSGRGSSTSVVVITLPCLSLNTSKNKTSVLCSLVSSSFLSQTKSNQWQQQMCKKKSPNPQRENPFSPKWIR